MLPTLGVWLAHFEYHATRRFEPEDTPATRSGRERDALARAPVLLQCEARCVGEHLLEQARRSAGNEASALLRVLELLIAEEQHHARLLRSFAQPGAGGTAAARIGSVPWLIGLLRRSGGFEAALTVLAATELIGSVYYRVLGQAARSAPLRALCRAILADELSHIGLLSELLAALRAGRSRRARALTGTSERLLLSSLALVVWLAHGRLLRRCGCDSRRFRAACRAQYELHLGPAPACAPASSSAPGEELRADIAEGLELEHVAGRVVEEHGRLLAR